MLISNLMLNIQTHAQSLATEYVADLVSNPKTPHIAMRAHEDLERAALTLYARLADWLHEKDAEEVEAEFRARARRQRKAGIPLSEIVYAVVLLKKHVWEFVKRNAVVDSINDLYQRDEVIVLMAEFFDRVLFSTAKGYEDAEESWSEPGPLRFGNAAS
jgi:hypothetical protein